MQPRRGFLKFLMAVMGGLLPARLLAADKPSIPSRPAAGPTAVSPADERTIRKFYGDGWTAGSRSVVQSLTAHEHQCSRLFDRYRSAFPDLRVDVQSIQKNGDQIVVKWAAQGTHRGTLDGLAATGRRVQSTGITRMRIVDGNIMSAAVEWDEKGLKAQLGPKGRA
jgi:steroid delta-isomerase-like uncharacterized protein